MLGKGDSGAQAYWFDSESSLYDSEAIVGPLVGRGLLIPYFGESYEAFARFVDDVLGKAKPDDWVMVDKADAFWSWTQSYYLHEVKGKDLVEARRDANKQGKNIQWGGITEEIKRGEWTIVNDYYFTVMNPLVLSSPQRPKLHLGLITELKGKDEDDYITDEFHGMKPTGQKELAYQMRTLVHLEKRTVAGQGSTRMHTYTTTERHGSGRPHKEREQFSNFALSYLFGVAGWSRTPSAGGPGLPTPSVVPTDGHEDLSTDGEPSPAVGSTEVGVGLEEAPVGAGEGTSVSS